MPVLYLDIETTGLDPLSCELVTLQLMTSSGKVLIIKDPASLEALKPKLESNLIVGHNLKFDSKFLKHHYGITLYHVYDTYLAEIAISGGTLAGKKGASLKDLVKKYCGVTLDKTEQLGFKKGEALTAEQERYAANDLKYLPTIMKQQQVQIMLKDLENTIDIEMKCLPAVVWMELSGIHVNSERFEAIKAQVQDQCIELEGLLRQALEAPGTPEDLNLNSPAQIRQALRNMGYEVDSTGKQALAKYKGIPIFDALEDYKKIKKLYDGFIKKLPDFINPVTKRIHANFSQYGAASGRFTCKNPNLQQQPSRFKEWRSIYTAEPGNKIVACDFSQIELRIAGQLAGEEKFIDAYSNGRDLHKRTAAAMFGIPEAEISKDQRNAAKAVNFGLNYGLGSNSLKARLKQDTGQDFTVQESKKFIREFKKLYPKLTEYMEKVSNEGMRTQEAKTAAGRRFKFVRPEEVTGDKYNEWLSSVGRNSKSWPIQGLCADMLKISMGNLFLILEPKGVKLVNCIHDELVFECKAEEAIEVGEIVKTEMEKAGSLFLKDLPCVAEVTIADFWRKD